MHTRIYKIVYIIIPAPVVFPFAGQATSHAAPPVAHRARRGVHPRFYARWRLDQIYSAAARRVPGWFAENRRTLISPLAGNQQIRFYLCQTTLQFRVKPLDDRFTFRPVMNIFRHRTFYTDGFSQPFAVNVALVNALTTLPQNAYQICQNV